MKLYEAIIALLITICSLHIPNIYANNQIEIIAHTMAVNKEGHLFAGSRYGGIYQTLDNGQSYELLGLQSASVEVVAVNPSNDIFAGTLNKGIYRSQDNGNIWKAINNGLSEESIIACFLFLKDGTLLVICDGDIYRSNDNGDTWNISGFSGNDARWLIQLTNDDILVCTWDQGIYRSTDNGFTWALTGETTTKLNTIKLIEGQDGTLYACTRGQGLYISNDTGNNWMGANLGSNKENIHFVSIDSDGNAYTSIENFGVYQSTNNGGSWVRTFLHLPAQVFEMVFIEDGHIYAGTAHGLIHSSTNGDEWQHKPLPADETTMGNLHVHTIATNSLGDVIVGKEFGGVFRSVDNGEIYDDLGFHTSDVEVISINESDIIFLGTSGEGAFRSMDNGNTWTHLTAGEGNLWVWGLRKTKSLVLPHVRA